MYQDKPYALELLYCEKVTHWYHKSTKQVHSKVPYTIQLLYCGKVTHTKKYQVQSTKQYRDAPYALLWEGDRGSGHSSVARPQGRATGHHIVMRVTMIRWIVIRSDQILISLKSSESPFQDDQNLTTPLIVMLSQNCINIIKNRQNTPKRFL